MVSPPSRGRRKAGALVPSARSNLRAAAASVFRPDVFAAAGVFARGFADSAAASMVDSPGGGDFNFLDGALCDARAAVFPSRLLAVLADFFTVVLRVLAAGVLADDFDGAWVAFPAGGLGDFLRVFLDIRLPFVAFGGSIIGGAARASVCRIRADCWASLMGWEYGYREFVAPPVRSLNVLLGPDDE